MDYNEIIKRKNKILAITLLVCIVLRSVVNAYFTGFGQVVAFMAAGLILTTILVLLNKKVHPVVMMYLIVLLMSGISIALMKAFPCTTNYLMFFLSIFFVVIYEDIRPIVLQCAVSAVFMVIYYFEYKQKLAETWSPDAMAMCVVYIISGMLVYISLCRLTKQQFRVLQETGERSNTARKKAEKLLGKIGKSVDVLGNTSGKINKSVVGVEEIVQQITVATNDVAGRAMTQVQDIENIKNMVEQGVDQIQEVSDSSAQMAEASNKTNMRVENGARRVNDLTQQMSELNAKMEGVAVSITQLTEENAKIVDILATLDNITSQTNLLSLNASIEAARAGEHGKGFAVVASEIRQLSETSSKFTEQIHSILEGIQKQTDMVCEEIARGQESVSECTQHAEEVNNSFQKISYNTKQVLDQARNIEDKSNAMDELMHSTLENVSRINADAESTSAAMEEVSASIADLHENIAQVVSGYNNINEITSELVSVAER